MGNHPGGIYSVVIFRSVKIRVGGNCSGRNFIGEIFWGVVVKGELFRGNWSWGKIPGGNCTVGEFHKGQLLGCSFPSGKCLDIH